MEIKADLWTFHAAKNLICITTNGMVKKNGEAVMGRGCAAQMKERYPDFPKKLGDRLKEYGNVVMFFKEYGVITFPVKHKWFEKADIELIKKSCLDLSRMVFKLNCPVFLPRPGCGNGQLKWEEVKPVIEPLLCEHIWVISNE